MAIVSYGFAEAASAFARAELALHTLTDIEALLELAHERGTLNLDQVAVVERWLADPYAWSATN